MIVPLLLALAALVLFWVLLEGCIAFANRANREAACEFRMTDPERVERIVVASRPAALE